MKNTIVIGAKISKELNAHVRQFFKKTKTNLNREVKAFLIRKTKFKVIKTK